MPGQSQATLFRTDRLFRDWVQAHPTGFVLNIRSRLSPDYIILHTPTCRTIRPDGYPSGALTENAYRKVGANSVSELARWVAANVPNQRGITAVCKTCSPAYRDGDLSVAIPSNASPRLQQAGEPEATPATAIALLWMSGDPEGYTDLLPSWWFDDEGVLADQGHSVIGPSGSRFMTARCSVIVQKTSAQIDYGGRFGRVNRKQFDPGVTRLNFTDETRRWVQSVDWRDETEDRFSKADVNCSYQVRAPADDDAFDPSDETDGRRKIAALVARRQGQPGFRARLIEAYAGRCAITGCTVEPVLEAAHISAYRGQHTNHVTNGLLLRADIHTLFDVGLIRIDHEFRVHAEPEIKAAFELPDRLTLPRNPTQRPNVEALRMKFDGHSDKAIASPGT